TIVGDVGEDLNGHFATDAVGLADTCYLQSHNLVIILLESTGRCHALGCHRLAGFDDETREGVSALLSGNSFRGEVSLRLTSKMFGYRLRSVSITSTRIGSLANAAITVRSARAVRP